MERKIKRRRRKIVHRLPDQRHPEGIAHCVTNVVLFVGARRDSDRTCGSSLCRSRSKEAGTAELRAESDDADESIGEARLKTWGRGGSEEDGA